MNNIQPERPAVKSCAGCFTNRATGTIEQRTNRPMQAAFRSMAYGSRLSRRLAAKSDIVITVLRSPPVKTPVRSASFTGLALLAATVFIASDGPASAIASPWYRLLVVFVMGSSFNAFHAPWRNCNDDA